MAGAPPSASGMPEARAAGAVPDAHGSAARPDSRGASAAPEGQGAGARPDAREGGAAPDAGTASAGPDAQAGGAAHRVGGAPVSAGVPGVGVPPGELRARVVHGDFVLGGVREDVTGGAYDPIGALRRVVRAVAPVAVGRVGVVSAAALLVARSAVAGADDVIATHRGAVGSEARMLLAEARRRLGPPLSVPAGREPTPRLGALIAADTLAQQARDLAEQDVRLRGNPLGGREGHGGGLAGAVVGGVLPGGDAPVGFGGPRARARRTASSA
jgi:hypothetical protein